MTKENPFRGERHYTSTVLVVAEQKPRTVLLVHHKKLGKWMPPGGHQEDTENPYEAAVRETKEETGIDISDYLPKPVPIDDRAFYVPVPQYILEEKIDAQGNQFEHYHLDMIYVVYLPQQKVNHQESESHSIGWFTQEEVENLPIFENVLILIKTVLGLSNTVGLSSNKQQHG